MVGEIERVIVTGARNLRNDDVHNLGTESAKRLLRQAGRVRHEGLEDRLELIDG